MISPGKPRIRRFPDPKRETDWAWICIGCGTFGLGATPRDAWMVWVGSLANACVDSRIWRGLPWPSYPVIGVPGTVVPIPPPPPDQRDIIDRALDWLAGKR